MSFVMLFLRNENYNGYIPWQPTTQQPSRCGRDLVSSNEYLSIINTSVKFYGVLNVVSGKSYTYSDITRIISGDLSIDLEVSFQKRTKDKVDHRFSSERIKNATHNFCFTSLESGIRLMHDSMQKNK